MELTLPLDDFGACLLPLNVKVYSGGKGVGVGNKLKWIILEFKRQADGSIKLVRQDWTH